LEQKTTEKTEFNDTLITSLKGIKDKIATLSSKITDFKLLVDGLQGQVDKNDANVKGKEGQIDSITQQVTKLEDEKKQLIVQFTQAQEQINKQGTDTQQKINTYENQLRDLTAKNADIQKQLDTVTAELNGNNDTKTQHSQQLQTQAEEAKQQLEAQSQANQAEQLKLTTKINELEANLSDLHKQLQDKTGETVAHVDTINKNEQLCQTQIADLTAKIKDLQTTNDDLINRIVAATGVINSTVDKLQELIMNEPNPNNITNEIAEIEQAIENISRVIQGQTTAQPGTSVPPPGLPELPGTTEITIQGTTQTLDEIKNQLSVKSQQLKKAGYLGPDKYADTLVKLRGARTPGDVEQIVTRVFRDGKVWGGNKTKKRRRKQKGGFTYKNKANRRTITTSKQAGGFIYKDSAKRSSVTTSSTKRKRRNSKSM
jgi:DNA repair exonuclease SbcCD ATPase subunit